MARAGKTYDLSHRPYLFQGTGLLEYYQKAFEGVIYLVPEPEHNFLEPTLSPGSIISAYVSKVGNLGNDGRFKPVILKQNYIIVVPG
jgi:hypothetical protein